MFFVLAIAGLGTVGVTTATMGSTTTAHAVTCHQGGAGTFVCPLALVLTSRGFVCNQHFTPPSCKHTGH